MKDKKFTKKNKKGKKTAKITKSMTFAEIAEKSPESIKILSGKGMHCIGCPMAMQETLEQGAMAHGLDADALLKELNKKLKNKR